MTGAIQTVCIALILVFSIILHEVSHGVAALWNGDRTALERGRLTLNPLPHVDPVGSIVVPLVLYLSHAGMLFGWARPVPFDPRCFRNRRLGILTVGLAGPLTNVLLALAFAGLFRFAGLPEEGREIALYGAAINLGLALFNLIPIPPMDGSRAVLVFLPPAARRAYLSLERWGFVIVAALIYFGVFRRFLTPALLRSLSWLLGVEV